MLTDGACPVVLAYTQALVQMAYSLIKFGEVPNKLPAGFQFPAEGVAPVSSSEKKADAGGEGKTPALPADASAPLVAGEKCKWWVANSCCMLATPHRVGCRCCWIIWCRWCASWLIVRCDMRRRQADTQTTVCMNVSCLKSFGVFTRRHHCRKCGRIFCDDCTKVLPAVHHTTAPLCRCLRLLGRLAKTGNPADLHVRCVLAQDRIGGERTCVACVAELQAAKSASPAAAAAASS